jgi:hypothetical protein
MIALFQFFADALKEVWIFLNNIIVYSDDNSEVSYLALIVAFAVLTIVIRLIPKPQ